MSSIHPLLGFLFCLLIVLSNGSASSADAASPKRPNILWIVSEDNDPFLGCYGDVHAHTPNLDKLASQGVLYTNAFANAPVCAPSRCTLITGVYASSLGTEHMRSQYRIPQEIRPFTQYLREAGYYCTNPGKKTDFNFSNWQPRRTYDGQGDWSGRKAGQPFFCVFNFMTTHVRNYMPHRTYGEHLNYLWKMPATVSWEREFKAGRCNELQSVFWHEKPSEELYDEVADHYEVHNLVEDPKYAEVLARLRAALREHLLKTRDTGFLPETEMVRCAGSGTIRAMAMDETRYPLTRILEVAEAASRRDPTDVPRLIEWMKEPDPAIRYWAAMGCCVRKKGAASAEQPLLALLKDPSPPVRITAAEALCWLGRTQEGLRVLSDATSSADPMDSVLACDALDALGDVARPAVQSLAKNPPHGTEYLNNLGEWLGRKFVD